MLRQDIKECIIVLIQVTGKTMMTKKYKLHLDAFNLTTSSKNNRIPRNRGTFQLGPDKCAV
jgi:hypothetical protein